MKSTWRRLSALLWGVGVGALCGGEIVLGGALVNGVASGDVSQHAAVLWSRTDSAGSVTFEVSDDPTFSSIVASQVVNVANPLIPAKWNASGLSANQQYYYRATASGVGGESATGSFRTAARAGTANGAHFGVSGDWRGELAPYSALANAAGKNLDFFVKLGDTIYADVPSPGLNLPQAQTLDQYRAKHNEVYSERLGLNVFRDLQASTPIYATIDDHEVTNDFAGAAPATSDARFAFNASGSEQFINQTPLFRNGLTAFQEYNAIAEKTYNAPGNARFDGAPDLYRSQNFGSAAAMFLLDNRSFRDLVLPEADLSNPLSVGAFLANSLQDSTRTMLGDLQLAKLKSDLLASDAAGVTWKFVMVAEPIQNLGPAAAGDRFEGYAYERNQLLKFIDENNIDNVVFISADIHGTVINNLTYQDPSSPLSIFAPQIPTNAFEVVTGSVAYQEPFGPTVISLAESLGLLGPANIPPPFNAFGFPTFRAFYDFLGTLGQQGAQESIVQNLLNQQLISVPSPYDPIGLTNNLPQANGLIDATLISGGWTATTTYGWTEFDIDPRTHQLLVTTWGIPYYTAEDLAAHPERVLALTPAVVSQFSVNPQNFTAVPEPGTLVLCLLSAMAAPWLRRRRS